MKHDPDPRFLDHLEWQMESALRRRDRFARPVPTGALRLARTLALVLLCTVSGAGLVVAAEKIQNARQQELLLERNRIELVLAERRMTRAAQAAERAAALHDAALTTRSHVDRARLDFEQTTWRAQQLQLDRSEIEITGRTPDLEISAPLAGGRDFVARRMRLEQEETARRLEIAERELERAEAMVREGLVSDGLAHSRRAQVEGLSRELQALGQRLARRAEFLAGRLTIDAAHRSDRLAALGFEREKAERELELVSRELERTRQLVAAGAASSSELSGLEDRLEEAETAIQLTELERRLIEED